jgi:hypothetical protein
MSIKRLVPLNAPALATLPAGATRTGDIVFYTEDDNLYVHDGTAWQVVGTGEGGGGSSAILNADGGTPTSVYGGVSGLDGGTP